MSIRKLKSFTASVALILLAFVSMAAARQPGFFNNQAKTGSNLSDSLITAAPAPPPVCLNEEAELYAKKFAQRNTYTLDIVTKRSKTYFPIMERILVSHGLPKELKYLAVIESNLSTKSKSRVGAVGLWQLMPVTARWMGLKVNERQDERTHASKSTHAAAKYLKILYKMFKGDWLLTIAAYNSGPGPVLEAIKKTGSRNFWKLQNHLPKETRHHVKRFISVHYYFEGTAGETTQTKSEWNEYLQVVEEFWTAQKDTLETEDILVKADVLTN